MPAPRLTKLLLTLLGQNGPVTVRELADRLGVSRRTVFRELEKAEPLLKEYGLTLTPKAAEGLMLEGETSSRQRLETVLQSVAGGEPPAKRERHLRLLLSLLLGTEQQKLFSYADELGVSVATISHDLDMLENRLARFGLALSRRQGYGVSVEGEETDVRRAMLDVLRQMTLEGYGFGSFPSAPIRAALDSFKPDLDRLAGWMAPASRLGLELYLATAAERIASGRIVREGRHNGEFLDLADELATLLEQKLSLSFPEGERRAISMQLAACRRNTGVKGPDADDDSGLITLACRMIEEFDPELAPLMKMDQALLEGLVSHLRSAVVRLEEQVWVDDPLEGELARAYPDLVRKTRNAASILETYDQWLPDSEISFLAAHFGAAMLRLSGRGMRKKTVRAVIVCVNGIGTSHLLAAQIKRHFGGELEIEVGGWGDFDGWKSFDFMISTTPVDRAAIPVVVVPPVLDDAALRRIREETELRAWVDRSALRAMEPASAVPLAGQCRAIEQLVSDAADMLEGFRIFRVDAAASLADMARFVGSCYGETPEMAARLMAALLERERISTQVVPELGIILLHCRDDTVDRPRLALLVPEGGSFSQAGLERIRSCLVMLMPRSPLPASLEIMGQVSSLLLEDSVFLEAVQEGNETRFRHGLEELLRSSLPDFIMQKLQG